MTTQKLHVLLDDYRDRLSRRFGAVEPVRDAKYSGRGDHTADPQTLKDDVAHLFWMLTEAKTLLAKDKVPKAMRWLGFLQHAMLSFQVLTLEDIKQAARDHDEMMFPPPPGLNVVQAKVHALLVTQGGLLTVLVRQTWLPQGLGPRFIKWPNIDPDKRLPVLEDLGIHVNWQVGSTEWDYTDCSLNVYLQPTLVHPRLSEESVGLAIGMYRQAGWDYQDADAKKWPERMNKFREAFAKGGGHHPGCPNHPGNQGPTVVPHGGILPPFLQDLVDGMFGAPQVVMGGAGEFGPDDYDDEEDDPPPPKPKKAKKPKPKKKQPPKEKPDAGSQEGGPDAGGN